MDIAGGCDHRVPGRVPLLETVHDRAPRKAAHGRTRAQDRRTQRMPAPKALREGFVRQGFRIIVLHADLFENDLFFLGDIFFGKERSQHQIGEHIESDRQIFVQDFSVKADHLLGSEGVEQTSHRIHFTGDLFGSAAGSALEDHVLDEMGNAIQARGFSA